MPVDPIDPQGNLPPGEPPEYSTVPMARPVSADVMVCPPLDDAPATKSLSALSAGAQLLAMVAVVVITGIVGVLLARGLGIADERWQQLLSTGVVGVGCVMAAAIMVWKSGEKLAVLGWRTDGLALDIAIGVAATFLLLAATVVLSIIVFVIDPDPNRGKDTMQRIQAAIPPMSVPITLLVMFLVAVWEETVFRGFILTRLHVIIKRWWLVIAIGALLFAPGHGYQGWLAMVQVVGLGLTFGLLFVWRRSLVPCIVCHMAFNTVMMLLIRVASSGMQ